LFASRGYKNMKKFLVLSAFSFLLLASLTSAQETYSISVGGTTANRNSIVGMLELGRVQNNTDVCTKAVLPANCTQAQACVALNVAGGAACTGADAITARARIYPASTLGREAFVANELIRIRAPEFYAEQVRRDTLAVAAFCAISQANRDALCTLLGLPAGCGACNQ
jgi:hypothetical protein